MNTETITWRKGDDPADLARLCDRATETKVEVAAVYAHDDHRVTVAAIPHRDADERTVGVYVVTQGARSDRRGIAASFALESVTATLPPERPSWLPEGVEDGDWLVNGETAVYQWRDGELWAAGSTWRAGAWKKSALWTIWPVWAEVKAERERLRAEVDRLSTVTDEMVEAAYLADISTFESRGDIRRALEAALAVRDGGES